MLHVNVIQTAQILPEMPEDIFMRYLDEIGGLLPSIKDFKKEKNLSLRY